MEEAVDDGSHKQRDNGCAEEPTGNEMLQENRKSLASQIAKILCGKNKPGYTPHVDCGDNVIVINAEKVKLTGNKMTDKVYVRHTGFPGGQRFATPADYLAKKPEFVIEHAVKGMLPKTRLGEAIMKNLKVYAGAEHPHAAQNPKEIKLNEIK